MSIKQLYAARCQVCGTAIATPGGDYAEAAHIRPLGAPHDGPDHPSNVLCLCPNHHVMFDLGGIVIRDDFTVMEPVSGAILSSLHVHPDHQIDPSHIRYHRSLFMDDAVVPFERDSVDFRTSRERGQSSEQSKLFG